MKHLFPCIICSFLASVFLAGCGKPGAKLIGAWSSHDDFNYGQQRCEFFKDDSGFLEQGQRFSATWSALDDGRLKVTVTTGGGPNITMLASVTGDELLLDEGDNRRISYVREGSPKAAEVQAIINKNRSDREVRIEAEKRAQVERYAAQQREEARQREAERIAQARKEESDRIARARKEESDRIALEREQEAKRAFDAGEEAFKRGLYSEGIVEYEKSSQLGNADASNMLAWHFATCKDPKQHNGKKAVELGLEAVRLKPQEANGYDTLAAAYARNSQFEQAVSTQIRALSLNRDIVGGEDRLKLYRQNKAFQEEEPDKIADCFMSLLVAGKHLEIPQMLSKNMKRTADSLGGVSNETLKRHYRFGAFKSYTLTPDRDRGDTIRYVVVAVTKDGETHDDVLYLVREGAYWKISEF